MNTGWAIEAFDEVLQDVTGGNIKTLQSDFQTNGKYPIIDQGQNFIAGYTDDENRLCKTDTPVIVFGDHTKILKFVSFPFCLGADGTKVLKPKIKADEKYLFYYLQTVKIPEAGYSRHYKYLKQAKIPLPPLEEQKRIAAILDQADALRKARRKAIARLNDLSQSIFYEMFGDVVSNIQNVNTTIEDGCLKITDGTHHSPPIQNSGIPYITAKHLKIDGLDFYSNPWFVSEEDHKNIYSRCNPEMGDVLYIKDGATTGIAAINPYNFEFSMLSSLALLKPNLQVCLPHYLVGWLNNTRVKEYMVGSMAGAGITRLTLKKIKSSKMFFPSLEQQKVYVNKITLTLDQRNQACENLLILESLFNSLQQRAFRGEL